MARGPVDPRMLRHARGALPGVAGLVATGAVTAVAGAASLVAAGLLVAALVARPGVVPVAEVAVLAGAVVARALAAWAQPVIAARTAARVVDGLRERLLTAGGEAPVALLTRGLDDLRPWFTGYLPALVLGVVLPPAVLVALVVVDGPSALVVALTLPLLPVFAALLGWATRARAQRQWAAGERLGGHVLDVVAGLATLRLFGRARRQVDEVARLGEAHRRATVSVLRVAFLSTTALDLVATVSVGLVAVSAGLRVVDGSLGLAPALVAILLAPEAYRPIREVGARFHDTARVGAVLDAVDAVLGPHATDRGPAGSSLSGLGDPPRPSAPDPDPAGTDDAGPGPADSGPDVRVRGVRVRYPGRRADALALGRLDVAAGELVALAGPSGAGKTTLLRVLAGLRAADEGVAAVTGRVVLLPQDPTLPHAGTVREALDGPGSRSRPSDDPALRAVLARVGLALDPDAPLAEGGRSLSAGQRHRLALARVLCELDADPHAVVLLDEPTAHLDDATEVVVLAALRAVADAGAAVLLVAHRPAALAAADRVVTMRPAQVSGPGRDSRPNRSPGAQPRRVERGRGPVPGVLLGAGSVLAGLVLTAASAWLIVRAGSRPPVLTLSLAVVVVRATAIGRPLLRHLERVAAHDAALRRVGAWRRRLVADLVDRVPGAVAGRRGHLLARLIDDVDVRLDGLVRGRHPLAVAAVVLPVVLVAAGLAVPALVLPLGIGLVLAAVVVPLLAAGFAGRDGRAEDRAGEDLVAAVVETVAGRADLAGRGTDALLGVPRARARSLDLARRRSAGHLGTSAGLAHLAVGAGTLAAALVAAGSTAASPELVAIVVLTPLAIAETLLGLPDAARAVVRGRQARRRLRDVAATIPPATEPVVAPVGGPLAAGPATTSAAPGPARSAPLGQARSADLAVRDLVAGWDEVPAVRGIDLDLPGGARVAVTGASGSGKSTLAAVVLRLLDPVAGAVTLDGTDLRALPGDAARRRVGLVGEHDHVFATTVRENLRLAAPEAGDDELRTVLRRVRLGDWLDALTDGLDTWIGADTVSGGERRRLAAARVLLADPAVLVLDEPTEGLDADTAEALMDDLLADPQRSVLLLAHRREGLDRVDAAYELADGRLRASAPAAA